MTPEQLKPAFDKLQEGLPPHQMAIREGIVIDVGEGDGRYDRYPNYGYQFFCFRSPEMVQELDVFIKYAKGKKLFLDCGAYHGIFSLVFSKLNPEGEAFAIEPFEEPFAMLEQVCDGVENIYLANIAFSDNSDLIRMKENGGHLEADPEGDRIIKCIKGDDFLDKETLPDLIKIDVEKMELKVLKGLRRIITQCKPTIFLEIHHGKLGKKEVAELCDLIQSYGYNIYDTATENILSPVHILNGEGEQRVILQ